MKRRKVYILFDLFAPMCSASLVFRTFCKDYKNDNNFEVIRSVAPYFDGIRNQALTLWGANSLKKVSFDLFSSSGKETILKALIDNCLKKVKAQIDGKEDKNFILYLPISPYETCSEDWKRIFSFFKELNLDIVFVSSIRNLFDIILVLGLEKYEDIRSGQKSLFDIFYYRIMHCIKTFRIIDKLLVSGVDDMKFIDLDLAFFENLNVSKIFFEKIEVQNLPDIPASLQLDYFHKLDNVNILDFKSTSFINNTIKSFITDLKLKYGFDFYRKTDFSLGGSSFINYINF
jgi:hypothetical protein